MSASMLAIAVTPQFQRMLRKLEPTLQEKVKEKITLFADPANHQGLRVHKLRGRLRGRYSFSVNYETRIVFMYENKKSVILTAIGSHDVYDT